MTVQNVAVIKNAVVFNVVAVDDTTRASTKAFWQAQGYTCVDNAAAGPGDGYVNGQFIPKPVEPPPPSWIISRVALQNRFPLTSNGVSTKYDLMTLFLTDTAYANSLGVSGQDLIDQRAMIITGNNRLGTAEYVDLKSQQTIGYVTLCTNAVFPAVFRLTQAEADTILNTPAQPDELP